MTTQNFSSLSKKSNSVHRQARLLMVGNRQRQHNRQASMLERAAKQIGL